MKNEITAMTQREKMMTGQNVRVCKSYSHEFYGNTLLCQLR